MKKKGLFKKTLLHYLLIYNILFVSTNSTFANDQTNDKFPSIKYLEKKSSDNYVIGAGDTLSIIPTRKIPALSGIYQVGVTGHITLPKLNRVYIAGLTIYELIKILNTKYSEYLISPNVEVTVYDYRPVKVYVKGEIENPGLYALSGNSSPIKKPTSNNNINSQFESKGKSSLINDLSINQVRQPQAIKYSFPTVFNALQSAGGVTLFSKLDSIIITRVNSLTKGGGMKRANINFLEYIVNGDTSQNPRLADGDILFIQKSEKPLFKQLSPAIKSNLNPKFIKVFVYGRVNQPGLISTNKTSTLVEAIKIAGGPKVIKGKVNFLRYNNDNSIDQREFRYSSNASSGSHKNPYLKQGDIVYVRQGFISSLNEVVGEVSSPFLGLYSTFKLMDTLN